MTRLPCIEVYADLVSAVLKRQNVDIDPYRPGTSRGKNSLVMVYGSTVEEGFEGFWRVLARNGAPSELVQRGRSILNSYGRPLELVRMQLL